MGSENQVAEDFERKRHLYEAFTTDAEESIRRVLKENGVHAFSYESRTKGLDSLRKKVERSDKEGKYSSIDDVTDLSGIRFIGYLQEDCEKAAELIRSHFDVDDINSIDKGLELAEDRFGYQSTHLIISYSNDRLKLPEFKRFSGLKAELQIKTLLQHTWAAIDWKLRYKGSISAPRQLRRRLYRISALLDAADDEFSFVSAESARIREEYENSIRSGDLAIGIDLESLEAFIKSDRQAALVKDLTKDINSFSIAETDDRTYGKLLNVLEDLGIASIERLSEVLHKDLKSRMKRVKKAFETWRPEGQKKTSATSILMISIIAGLSHAEAEKVMEKIDLQIEFKRALLQSMTDI